MNVHRCSAVNFKPLFSEELYEVLFCSLLKKTPNNQPNKPNKTNTNHNNKPKTKPRKLQNQLHLFFTMNIRNPQNLGIFQS